jgi:hypothetical protein
MLNKFEIRIECPKCCWGYAYRHEEVNKGYRKAKCIHCGNEFWYKITINKIDIDVCQDRPDLGEIINEKI